MAKKDTNLPGQFSADQLHQMSADLLLAFTHVDFMNGIANSEQWDSVDIRSMRIALNEALDKIRPIIETLDDQYRKKVCVELAEKDQASE